MGLHRLDFLSNAPRNFIFQNNSNKTNFGGFLTLAFLIIVLIIFIFYLIYYLSEETFTVQYIHYEKYLNEEEIDKRENDIKYNPYFDFIFDMGFYGRLPDEFILVNLTNEQLIPRSKTLNIRTSDVNIGVLYKCHETDFECIIPEEYQNFIFGSVYHGFILDHQNGDSALHKGKDYMKYYLEVHSSDPSIFIYNWRTVKYNTDAGFKKFWYNLKGADPETLKDIGLTGYDTDSKSYQTLYKNESDLIRYCNETRYRAICEIHFNNDFNRWDEYSREKKSIFNALSNVCSLSLTVFNFLSFFLTGFYSNNFDNYKIVEKILFNIKPEKKEIKEKVELISLSEKTDSLLNGNEIEKEEIKNDNEKTQNEEANKINQEDDNFAEKVEKEKGQLPKFRFIDFLFNNIYFSKKCKSNRQEIISKCNELISKYYSIDSILYNQIKFENLLKDYKWNNQDLSKLDENKLVIQLKNLIAIYDSK